MINYSHADWLNYLFIQSYIYACFQVFILYYIYIYMIKILIDCLMGGWLIDWLLNWLMLIDWLIDWLIIDWLGWMCYLRPGPRSLMYTWRRELGLISVLGVGIKMESFRSHSRNAYFSLILMLKFQRLGNFLHY